MGKSVVRSERKKIVSLEYVGKEKRRGRCTKGEDVQRGRGGGSPEK